MSIPVKDVIKAGYGYKREFNKLKSLRDNELSSTNNQVYYDKGRNTAILNVKGTNPFSPKDLYADAVLGLYGSKGLRKTDRFKETKDTYDQIKQKYPQASIGITSHSLGKNIAELVTDKNKDRFIGVNGFFHPFKGTPSNERFKNYRTSNDVISAFASNSKNVKTVGGFKNPFGVLQNHGVDGLPKRIRI
jgi:hypothetical protein